MTEEAVEAYETRFPDLERIADNLALFMGELLGEVPRIDRVSARAKHPERFARKAEKVGPEGDVCYDDPLSQIQDQIGARVIVLYKSDVDAVADVVEQYFRILEREEHVPESPWEFGYFGHHWIFALPDDVIPADIEKSNAPRFFELQAKTLFEYAWSEASHDVAYKPLRELSADQQRRFAYAAAHAWGADRVFNELWEELGDHD